MGHDRTLSIRPALVVALLVASFAGGAGVASAQLLEFGNLEVTTFGTGGMPLKDLPIEVFQGSKRVASSTASVDGRATFTLAPGTYELRVEADGLLKIPGVVIAPSEVTRTNASFGRLVVSAFTNESATSAQVSVLVGSRVLATKATDRAGNATFDLPGANYSVRANADNEHRIDEFALEALNTTVVEATFARLEILATGGNGYTERALPVLVKHATRSALTLREGLTDRLGRFTVDVTPGNYSIIVNEKRLGAFNVTANITNLVLAEFGSILVYAKDESGNWTQGSVSVSKKGTRRALHETTINGFGIGDIVVEEGAYDVTVTKRGEAATKYFGIEVPLGGVVRLGEYANHDPTINAIVLTPARAKIGERINVTVDARDVDRDNLTYVFTTDSGTLSGEGNTRTYVEEGLAMGRISVTVLDDAGGSSARDAYAIDVTGRLTLTLRSATGVLQNTPITVYEELTGRRVDEKFSDSRGQAAFDLLVGLYKVKATAANELWIEHVLVPSSGTSYVVGADPATAPPVIVTSSPSDSAVSTRVGGTLAFSVTAKDPRGEEPQYRWYVDAEYASSESAFLYHAATGSDGNHTISVAVTNGAATASREWRVSVSKENHPPRIVFATAEFATVPYYGKSGLSVGAVDPDGDKLKVSWSAGEGEITNASSPTPTWTAPFVNTTTEVKIRVKILDGNATALAEVTIMVTPPTPAELARIEAEELAALNVTDEVKPRERVPGPDVFLIAGALGAVAWLTRRRVPRGP